MNDMASDSGPPTVPSAARPARHLFWPIFLVGLIGTHILSVVVMVFIATHDSSFAVEPDWYQNGLHYEQVVEQQRENDRLGWSVQLNVGQPLAGTVYRDVSCKVLDRAAAPVEDATVDLVAFAHLRASNRTSSVLLPHGPGDYRATMAFEDPGMWEFRLVITRHKPTGSMVPALASGPVASHSAMHHGKDRETFTQVTKREI